MEGGAAFPAVVGAHPVVFGGANGAGLCATVFGVVLLGHFGGNNACGDGDNGVAHDHNG